jgi:hypothetical protein
LPTPPWHVAIEMKTSLFQHFSVNIDKVSSEELEDNLTIFEIMEDDLNILEDDLNFKVNGRQT